MKYTEIKKIIKTMITKGIPFNPNEKIVLPRNMTIRVNKIRFRNIKVIVLNKQGLQTYADVNTILNTYIALKNITSFQVDDDDTNIKYMGSYQEDKDLYVSDRLNKVLNRYDLDTDKEVLPKAKAIEWFKDLGYDLVVYEGKDSLGATYKGVFEIDYYFDDTCNDKLIIMDRLEKEVTSLLKHF